MRPVVTPAEMAAIDAAAPEPVEVLIGRAGRATARAARRLLRGTYGRRVVVIAGKGNNGADGLEAARLLRTGGVRVAVVDAADAVSLDVRHRPVDLIVDAAYGTGFRGELEVPEVGSTPVLAVDIPSGVDGLTGEVGGSALAARATVTFAALKPGLVLEPGRSLAGDVELADIGLDVSSAGGGVVEAGDVSAWIPARRATAHKWRAAVLVVAGSTEMPGAAALAAASAQRAGAGMVRLAVPGRAADARFPVEAVGVDIPASGWARAAAEQAERCHAAVIGPGLGTSDAARTDTLDLLAHLRVPAVVDGDALTALGTDVASIVHARSAPTVLTPHDREFERLTGRPPASDRFASVRDLAASSGATVLLKGPTTLVASPGSPVYAVTTGDQRLATAGSGDVLAGVVGALVARGAEPVHAAAAGAWLHGRAAAHAAPAGLIASDLLHGLVDALAEVER
jgi:NAD(P)H-hydrate epimerase